MSIKDIARARIIKQMVQRVRSTCRSGQSADPQDESAAAAQKYCAMIVDDTSLRILSSCCQVYQILEEGVVVVENIRRKRQALPEVDAIYFLTPEITSIEALCQDFANEKQPQYKSAHVFLTRSIVRDEELMATIVKSSGLLARMHSFIEFNLSFVCYEKRVFHLDSPRHLLQMFPAGHADILHTVADELLSYCLTIGDKPNVRFHSNEYRLGERLASLLHHKLSNVDVPGLSRGKSQLIIVDRSIDLAPLFLHEYTYQACLYDLLDVTCCSPVPSKTPPAALAGDDKAPLPDDAIKYPVTTNEGKHETVMALLNESDDVYVRYRHQHLLIALKKIPEEIRNFLKENAAATLQRRRNEMSNEELQRAIHDLPEFQEMLARYSLHNSVSQRCLNELNRKGINKIGTLEQDLACGVDSSGKDLSARKTLSALGGALADGSIGLEEKLRLLLLYFSMTDGVRDEDRKKMMEAAQLPLEDSTSVLNFVRMKMDSMSGAASPHQNHTGHSHKLQRDKERRDFFAQRARRADMALSRFQPFIRDVMERAAQGTLHGGRFPLVAQMDAAARGALAVDFNDGAPRAVAVRARNKDWGFGDAFEEQRGRGRPAIEATSYHPSVTDSGRSVVTIFILGGVTLSETRAAYEVSRALGCEIFIGGSSILTPKNFLLLLKSLNAAQPPAW